MFSAISVDGDLGNEAFPEPSPQRSRARGDAGRFSRPDATAEQRACAPAVRWRGAPPI
ncbi:hypothetical protein [Streptomyces sparsus]